MNRIAESECFLIKVESKKTDKTLKKTIPVCREGVVGSMMTDDGIVQFKYTEDSLLQSVPFWTGLKVVGGHKHDGKSFGHITNAYMKDGILYHEIEYDEEEIFKYIENDAYEGSSISTFILSTNGDKITSCFPRHLSLIFPPEEPAFDAKEVAVSKSVEVDCLNKNIVINENIENGEKMTDEVKENVVKEEPVKEEIPDVKEPSVPEVNPEIEALNARIGELEEQNKVLLSFKMGVEKTIREKIIAKLPSGNWDGFSMEQLENVLSAVNSKKTEVVVPEEKNEVKKTAEDQKIKELVDRYF